MSKEADVLDWLRGDPATGRLGRTLTPRQAVEMFDAFRLGAIVFDLRQQGHPIEDANRKPGGGRWARHSQYFYDWKQPHP